jgi:transmembrane sensor
MDLLNKYIDNKNFILWVFHPDNNLEAWWAQFETDHPEEKSNILLARKVLLKFRTNHIELSEEEKIKLFVRVLQQVEEKQRGRKTWNFVTELFKYAAVALLFFSVGGYIFYQEGQKQVQINPQFFSQKITEPVPSGAAILIRSNGENILLKEDKSVLKYSADGKLVVNNDTIKAKVMNSVQKNALNQLIIPYGKSSEILLSDGTKVFLNAGSRLVYPENFLGKTREVFLAGEAFFEVKKDGDHPFIVQINDLKIKVLGTKFNVSAYPTDKVVETVLTEGRVVLEKNNSGVFDKEIELLPNQLASFDRTSRETDIRVVDTNNYVMWTEGVLKFEGTDLSRIVKRLERFYNIRFQFREPLLGGVRITGKLQLKEDRDEVVERVARAASVRIIKNGEDFYEILR